MQAGSLQFLANQGFDFNKWVNKGIGSIPFDKLHPFRGRHQPQLLHPDEKLMTSGNFGHAQALAERISSWRQVRGCSSGST